MASLEMDFMMLFCITRQDNFILVILHRVQYGEIINKIDSQSVFCFQELCESGTQTRTDWKARWTTVWRGCGLSLAARDQTTWLLATMKEVL